MFGSMKSRPALAAVLLTSAAMAVAGCGSSGGSSGSSGGSGLDVAVLMPDTTSSARYLTQDEPDFRAFFESKGMKNGKDYTIQNAKGDPAAMRTQADQAMQQGAKVLIVDGIDSGSAAAIEKAAKAKGVTTIDYDRLTLNGDASYYVSFDNVQVGKLQGEGLVTCNKAWGVDKPHVLEVQGAPTDNNGTLFAKGSDSVVDPLYKSGEYVKVGAQRIQKWDPANAQTYAEQQYEAHPDINSILVANDDMANGVITMLKNRKIQPKRIPVTGQDATVQGLQNILAGYQCMTVYKSITDEANAAGQLALDIIKGNKNPSSINGKTNNQLRDVPSVLLTPVSVTTKNMASTVVKDGAVDLKELCKGSFAAKCKAAGITP